MKKLVGYAVAVVGLIVMALGFNIIPLKVAFLDGIASIYVAGVGIAIIIVGIVISMKGRGRAQKEEEVPIYEGDKIVGYRRA